MVSSLRLASTVVSSLVVTYFCVAFIAFSINLLTIPVNNTYLLAARSAKAAYLSAADLPAPPAAPPAPEGAPAVDSAPLARTLERIARTAASVRVSAEGLEQALGALA